MKTELFRQLLGQWIIVRSHNSSRYYTVKLGFFSEDEKLINAEFAGSGWFGWLPIKDCVLVGVEEK